MKPKYLKEQKRIKKIRKETYKALKKDYEK